MKTIKEELTNTLEIKQSKFITIVTPIFSVQEKEDVLKDLKKKYPKASHYCYAFILENKKGMSDDREPSKTAGAPILNVLEKQQIVNVLAVVIRYFGGIKLGPGGLIRAYTKSILTVLEEAPLLEVQKGFIMTISFPYEKEKDICYFFKHNPIYKKSFDASCHYTLAVTKEQKEKLPSYLDIEQENEQYLARF